VQIIFARGLQLLQCPNVFSGSNMKVWQPGRQPSRRAEVSKRKLLKHIRQMGCPNINLFLSYTSTATLYDRKTYRGAIAKAINRWEYMRSCLIDKKSIQGYLDVPRWMNKWSFDLETMNNRLQSFDSSRNQSRIVKIPPNKSDLIPWSRENSKHLKVS